MVMYAGRIMERASTAALFKAPSHPYTIGLLRSIPRLDRGHEGGRLIPIPGLPPNTARPLPGCPFAARCPFTQPRCEAETPVLEPFGGDHEVACWRAAEIRAMDPQERDEAARLKAAAMD